MELILITQPAAPVKNEHKLITELFEAGLHTLHIRKPDFSTSQLKHYLEKIPSEFRHRIVIHSHHELAPKMKLRGMHITETHRKAGWWFWLKIKYYRRLRPSMTLTTSFHHLKELKRYDPRYSYCFISPVFESISKEHHKPHFSLRNLEETLEKSRYKVVGLGGIDYDKIEACRDAGLWGVALLGVIWEAENPVAGFIRIKERCRTERNESFQ